MCEICRMNTSSGVEEITEIKPCNHVKCEDCGHCKSCGANMTYKCQTCKNSESKQLHYA